MMFDLPPQTSGQASVPIFREVQSLKSEEPLAVLIASTAASNWKPVVQQTLASWATTGVAPDCVETSVPAEAITARDAIESLPIILSSDGQRAERGEALIRTVTPWCGAERRINVLVFFREGAWRGLNLSAGGTLTGPRLYFDILQQTTPRLIPILNADTGSCIARYSHAGARLTDTQVTSLTGDAAAPENWTERWTWTACGRPTHVDFTFTPQANGTTTFEASIASRDAER